jgi:hypothetical protein
LTFAKMHMLICFLLVLSIVYKYEQNPNLRGGEERGLCFAEAGL